MSFAAAGHALRLMERTIFPNAPLRKIAGGVPFKEAGMRLRSGTGRDGRERTSRPGWLYSPTFAETQGLAAFAARQDHATSLNPATRTTVHAAGCEDRIASVIVNKI